ncbi:MAG: hypothetical protein ACT4O5_10335, partial [Gammaproteobacteria bacterium]
MLLRTALATAIVLCVSACSAAFHRASSASGCQPFVCSTLIPGARPDDPRTNDCAYRVRNQWWLDYVAGS